MKTDKADERMVKSLAALQAFDLAIKDLIALDLDSKTITAFAKSSADMLIRTMKTPIPCMHGRCQQEAEEEIEHQFGRLMAPVKLHFCGPHAEMYRKSLKESEQ
ncbi:hypothetical protein [Sulfuricurvum sp.]|uniref:hypothetical protein n=1 Tax=Sulfuricurvum sp. TaxID=2025608 RepID=UPI003562F97D